MSIIQVATEELRPIICRYNGVGIFARALENIPRNVDKNSVGIQITDLLLRHIQFNFPFAGAPVCLAGKIALRSDLFQYVDNYVFRSASFTIAKHVFLSASNGMSDENHSSTPSSHILAAVFFATICEFFSLKNINTDPESEMKKTIRDIEKGYGVNAQKDVEAVFFALGFHLAAKRMVVDEFDFLDNFFSQYFPELIEYLKKKKMKCGKKYYSAYDWVLIHKSSEDGFLNALSAANEALRYYACPDPSGVKKQKEQILKGFENFVMLEKEFMDTL